MQRIQGWVEQGGTHVATEGAQGQQGPQGPPGIPGSTITAILGAAVVSACDFPGADAAQKIAAAAAALPVAGGVVDTRCLTGAAQAFGSDPFTGIAKPVTILMGPATFISSVNLNVPANLNLMMLDGAIISMNGGTTLTIQGGMVGSSISQHFAGLGSVRIPSAAVSALYPQWWPGTVASQIQAANDALGGNTGVVVIDSTVGSGSAASPSTTTTFIDLRPKNSHGNPTHSAVNITDGNAASDWAVLNTGGLSRTKLYVGYTVPSGAYPGDSGIDVIVNAFAGQAAASNATDALAGVLQTQANTDTLSNRAFNSGIEAEASLIGTGLLLYDIRALTANILGGTPDPAGTVGTARTVVGQGIALPPTGLHVGEIISLYGEFPGANVANQNTFSGTVNTNGTAVTWVSGDKFSDRGMVGNPITINGVIYVIASVANSTSLAIGSSAGVQAGVAYSMQGTQYSLFANGNVRIDTAISAVPTTDPNGGGGFIIDTSGGGGAVNTICIRDAQAHNGPNSTYTRKYFRVNNATLEIINQAFNAVVASISDGGNGFVAGTFGVGTNAPATNLDVRGSGTTGFAPLFLGNNNSAATARDVIVLALVNGVDVGFLRWRSDANASPVSASFAICSRIGGNDIERIFVDTVGNVGLNTTTPKSPLHVALALPQYANNAAAIAGGLTAGAFYRTGADPDPVCVVH